MSAAAGGPTVDADVLVTLATACRDAQQLRFDYATRSGEEELRRVEPHRLVYTGHRWYLLAWDSDRTDWRTFRADRVRRSCPPGRGSPRAAAGGRRAPRRPRCRFPRVAVIPARVRLHAPAISSPTGSPRRGLLTAVDEQSCVLETGGDSLLNLVAYLTSLDVAFDVLDPPELATCLAPSPTATEPPSQPP